MASRSATSAASKTALGHAEGFGSAAWTSAGSLVWIRARSTPAAALAAACIAIGGNAVSAGADGVSLDPMANANDSEKALYRLLLVPGLRAKYLGYVRDIAERWLDWKTLGPLAAAYQAVIAEDIKLDNRKLDTTENFTKGVTVDRAAEADGGGPGFGPPGRGGRGGFNDAPRLSLKGFADRRREYLLNYK